MFGWLRRILGGETKPEPAPAVAPPASAPVPAPVAALPPIAAGAPNAAGLASQALTAKGAPPPAPPVATPQPAAAEPLPAPEPAPMAHAPELPGARATAPAMAEMTPAAPELGGEELLLLLHVARAAGRRARPRVVAAFRDITGGAPNLGLAPRPAQVTRALNALARHPGRAASFLAQAEAMAAAARAPLPSSLARLSRR